MLNLTEPLRYRHLGTVLSLSGATLQARAEVGLLSRNVVVRGAINEEWSDIIERCPEEFDTGTAGMEGKGNGQVGHDPRPLPHPLWPLPGHHQTTVCV